MSMTTKLVGAVGLTLAAGALAAPLTIAAPAQARMCAIDHVSYKAPSRGTTVWIPTSLHAIWQQGGGTQTRTSEQGSETANTTGHSNQVGGEVGAEFGFAKASATYNHTWDKSTTRSTSFSDSWSYTLKLPAEKSRSRLYKKGFRFPITQYTVYTNGCSTRVTRWSVYAPVRRNGSGTYLWAVERYSHRGELK